MIIPFVSQVNEDDKNLWLSTLQAAMPAHVIADMNALTEADRESAKLAIVANPNPNDLIKLPNIIWVQSLWAGVERLVAELKDAKIRIVRMIDPQLAKTMAEAVFAWTLYLHRDMPLYRQQQEAKIWRPCKPVMPQDRTIGILGLGNLGRAAAARLREHGFKLCGWSRHPATLDGMETYSGRDGFETVLSLSDMLVILLPLTVATRGLFNADAFEKMRDGASLINFARGPIIDDQALIANIENKRLKHAVLDVFDAEPLPKDHPFWSNPNITVLPHISAPTNHATASVIAAKNIAAFLKTGEIPKSVDTSLGY